MYTNTPDNWNARNNQLMRDSYDLADIEVIYQWTVYFDLTDEDIVRSLVEEYYWYGDDIFWIKLYVNPQGMVYSTLKQAKRGDPYGAIGEMDKQTADKAKATYLEYLDRYGNAADVRNKFLLELKVAAAKLGISWPV